MASTKGDITALEAGGWLNEPYTMERVLAAAQRIPQPFILRELVRECGLPAFIVHARLDRLVKKGVLVRRKVPMSGYHHNAGRGVHFRPGVLTRRVYLYSFVEGAE